MNQKNKDPLGTKKPTVLTKDQMRQQIRQALASSRGESPQPSGAAPQLNRSAREPETASASTVRPQQRPQMRQAVPNRTAASAASLAEKSNIGGRELLRTLRHALPIPMLLQSPSKSHPPQKRSKNQLLLMQHLLPNEILLMVPVQLHPEPTPVSELS